MKTSLPLFWQRLLVVIGTILALMAGGFFATVLVKRNTLSPQEPTVADLSLNIPRSNELNLNPGLVAPTCAETQRIEDDNCYKDLASSTLVIGVLGSLESYQMLTDYLQVNLNDDLMSVIVEGGFDISYQDAKDQISLQRWDLVFAYSPMISMAARDNNYQWVGRMFPDSPSYYQSSLFVRTDSSINSISDINPTHILALGNFGSASSFYRPIYDLYGKSVRVTMNHRSAQIKDLVLSGNADIGASSLTAVQEEPELKIIHVSTDIPGSGLYISPNLAPTDRAKLTQLLLNAPPEIRDQREGANYGEGVEPDWEEFRRISLRVEEIIQCRTFEEDPVPLFCSEESLELPQSEQSDGSVGIVKGFQFLDNNRVRFNLINESGQLNYLVIEVSTLSGIPNGQTPATLNNKTVIVSSEVLFVDLDNNIPVGYIQEPGQIRVEGLN